jgi:hypothetical protein
MSEERKRKPTEYAELMFTHGANTAFPGILSKNGLTPKELADVLHKIAGGLEGIAIGLRATYILLKEVRDKTS